MGEYGRRIVLDLPFEQAVAEATTAIHAEGFDLVCTIDLRHYLVTHAHHDCRRYLLFGVLLPQLTLDALRQDPELGPLLLTTIAIYELPDGETAVAASPSLSPVVFEFGWRAGSPALAAIADRAGERLARAFDRLQRVTSESAIGARG